MTNEQIKNLMEALAGPTAEFVGKAVEQRTQPLTQRINALGEVIVQLQKRVAELEEQR
jgi:hypothetical protein